MVNFSAHQHSSYDWIGLSAGLLCAVHCALTPLLFAALPLLSQVGGWWGLLDVVFLLVSLVAVWGMVRSTGRAWVRRGAVVAWLVLAAGLTGERTGVPGSDYIMYLGAASLLVAHLTNIWYSRYHRRGNALPASRGGDAGAMQRARRDTHVGHTK